MIPWAILSPQSVFAQVTAECPYTLQWAPLPPKLSLPMRGSGPLPNRWFLGPIQAHNPHGISISSAVFAQMTTECSYTLQWDAPFLPENCPFPWGDLNPHLTHHSVGPPESSTKTASQSVQPFLQSSLVWQTDLQTDRQTDHTTWWNFK